MSERIEVDGAKPADSGRVGEREAFEKWARWACYADLKMSDGAYIANFVEQLWQAWKARAAIAAQGQGESKPFGYVSRDVTAFRIGTPQWQFTKHRVEPHGCIEAMPVYTAPPASPAGVPDVLRETLQKILAADPRKWEELSEPESEFERWAKARARYALSAAPSAPESNT